MGGTRVSVVNSAANLVSLCLPCHMWVESHRSCGVAEGLLVNQNLDPSAVPLVYRGLSVLLTTDGKVLQLN